MVKYLFPLLIILPLTLFSQERFPKKKKTTLYIGLYSHSFLPKRVAKTPVYELGMNGGTEVGIKLLYQFNLRKQWHISTGFMFGLIAVEKIKFRPNYLKVYHNLIYDPLIISNDDRTIFTTANPGIGIPINLGYKIPMRKSIFNIGCGLQVDLSPIIYEGDFEKHHNLDTTGQTLNVNSFYGRYVENSLSLWKISLLANIGWDIPFKNGSGFRFNLLYKYHIAPRTDFGQITVFEDTPFEETHNIHQSRHQIGLEVLYQIRKTEYNFKDRLSKYEYGSNFQIPKHQFGFELYSGVNFTHKIISNSPLLFYKQKPGATAGMKFHYYFNFKNNLQFLTGLKFNISSGVIDEIEYDITSLNIQELPNAEYKEDRYSYTYRLYDYAPFLSIPLYLINTWKNESKWIFRFGGGIYLNYHFDLNPYDYQWTQQSAGQVRILDFKRLTNPNQNVELGIGLLGSIGLDTKSGIPIYFNVNLDYNFNFISSSNMNEAKIFPFIPELHQKVTFKTSPVNLNFGIEIGLKRNRKRSLKFD